MQYQHLPWTSYQNMIRDLKSDKFDLEKIKVCCIGDRTFLRYIDSFRGKDGTISDKQKEEIEKRRTDLTVRLGSETYQVHMWSAAIISAALASLLRQENKGNLEAKINQKS